MTIYSQQLKPKEYRRILVILKAVYCPPPQTKPNQCGADVQKRPITPGARADYPAPKICTAVIIIADLILTIH